jgi:hypothetical protein
MTVGETTTKAVPSRGCLHVSSPEARLSDRSLRIHFRTGRRLHPKCLKKRTPAAKAIKRPGHYGTAEAVPFVEIC